MTSTQQSARAEAAAQHLRDHLPADGVLLDGGPGFDEAVRVWNAAVTRRPALVARPTTTSGVQAAVRAARAHRLPLSVRAGGHDWAGRSLRTDGLVVDLTRMRTVTVDEGSRTATVQGGATTDDVIAAAVPHGLVAATGTVRTVGFTGLTLGGGYGPLMGRYGLAADNMLGAEVVLADGSTVTADARHEPDLYWALRGGGGNFGVVTETRVRLHPVSRVLGGMILYPWGQAADVFDRLGAVLHSSPDELTVQSGLITGPDGELAVFLSPVWCGDLEEGRKYVDELQQLGTPVLADVVPRRYDELFAFTDGWATRDRSYDLRTRTVTRFSPNVIAALIDAGDGLPSASTGIAIHHFHGSASRVPDVGTAFGFRRPHFVVEIVASWDEGDGAAERAWTGRVSDVLGPHALPGGYAGLLGADHHEQIAHAYGPNAARLGAAKRRYDPEGAFTGIPLPPAPE
ncbi:FAD-binding oxidoreductase [Streptomyces sp. TS71-3]|uniref:FAD-binding oxidoreductase n=1 Tax=Streptomyces sp. TS71-3 TaxID=2733862 RepID=UPI001B2A6C5D|nr:FAD-binding oxidoreductase [Streptomyces sp. TS71-3]GHJ40381.1 6-hydroxy-D-nicotine oxidase [Streptomyces sp. TS71-3]